MQSKPIKKRADLAHGLGGLQAWFCNQQGSCEGLLVTFQDTVSVSMADFYSCYKVTKNLTIFQRLQP